MKMEIKGETNTVAAIPIGAKLPKSFNDRGAVKTWAPQEAEIEPAK